MFDVEAKHNRLVQLAKLWGAQKVQENTAREFLGIAREALEEVLRLQGELAHHENMASMTCPGPESNEWCGGECHSDCPTSRGEHATIDAYKVTAWEEGLKFAMATLPPPDDEDNDA